MAEIVDIEDSPSPKKSGPRQPTPEELKKEVHAYLTGKDLSSISLKALRLELETRFDLQGGGLDARKGEIRSIAEALVTEAQNATAPPLEPIPAVLEQEPAMKRRKMLAPLQAAGAPAPSAPEPLSPIKEPAPKKRKAPSAYALWTKDKRASVVEDLERSLQRKPTFAEICKAIPEKWKMVDEAQKAVYEQKAKMAKDQLALEPAVAAPTKAAKKPGEKKGGKGKGKGMGKNKAEDGSSMTRAEFFRDCPVLRCAFDLPGTSGKASQLLAPPLDLVARTFKSGGAGWFSSVKFDLPVGAQQVTVQAQVVMNVSGSKHWEDGEGYEAALKALESRAQEAVAAQGENPNPSASVEEEAPPTTPPSKRQRMQIAQAEALGENVEAVECVEAPALHQAASEPTETATPLEASEGIVDDAVPQDEGTGVVDQAEALPERDSSDEPAAVEVQEEAAVVPEEAPVAQQEEHDEATDTVDVPPEETAAVEDPPEANSTEGFEADMAAEESAKAADVASEEVLDAAQAEQSEVSAKVADVASEEVLDAAQAEQSEAPGEEAEAPKEVKAGEEPVADNVPEQVAEAES